ncbi:hypothetical protein BDZ97DRAFT_1912609 [Flammula alnicola]|nr:hypothetical protein BDZ97DRAFT_1912609 [Flammula alnicola]
MDVALSIFAGLGLRLFLLIATDAGPSSKLTTAVLGLWEGAIVHQLSGRSTSPNLDHFLAYGLRLAVDLLISKNLQRMVMVVLWSVLGTVTSEAIVPYASLRSALKKQRERERERRHRHSRFIPTTVPILSTPLPPRIRAYKPPEPGQPTPLLPETPPPQTSTPLFLDRPPTPPSFFLQETVASPSPKPVYIQTVQPDESSPPDALPVRPRSGLASIFERSPDSGSPLPVPVHLPTPPDSAQSANPSDGLTDVQINETYHDNNIPQFEHQLYTIPELSSPEDNATLRTNDDHAMENNHQDIVAMFAPSTAMTNDPLPVPNAGMRRMPSSTMAKWLASQSTNVDPEAIFATPFSPSMSPVPSIPVPVRMRHHDSSRQTRTPTGSNQNLEAEGPEERVNEDGNTEAEDIDHPIAQDSDSDPLRTPGARYLLNLDTDNEHDSDPLRTPQQLRPDEDGQLSPLSLNVRSALDNEEHRVDNDFGAASSASSQGAQAAAADVVVEDNEDIQIPGSLSQNLLLQPPLPPSGPLFRPFSPPPESPPPPSPSTIHSDPSDASVLSTRVPNKLYSRADELRQKAREEEKLRAQLEEERKLAETQGRTMDALQLKIKVRDMDAAAYKLHEKAARRYFVSRNPVAQSHKIDVHGLRPREAFDRIERAIVQANQEMRSIVHVIVGKGLHSINQQPTLKPAVLREMQRLKFKCEVNPRNPGQLIITLPTPVPP